MFDAMTGSARRSVQHRIGEIRARRVISIYTTRQILFAALRAGICGTVLAQEVGQAITNEQLIELYNLANEHDVAPIVADVLFRENLLEDREIKELYRGCLMRAVLHCQRMCYELERTCALLEENQIPHIPLKGAVIRDRYPEPWLRTSCDIDILVHERDLQRAEAVLSQHLNYTRTSESSHDISLVSEIGVHLELHYALIEPDVKKNGKYHRKWNANCLLEVWAHAVPLKSKKYQYSMEDELLYFYHIAHMVKHFESGGCGIRPILDLWLLNNGVTYDAVRRKQVLEDGRLAAFEAAMKRLSHIWFSGEAYDDLSIRLEDYMVASGAYGTLEHYTARNRGRLGGRFRYALSRIFVSDDLLQLYFPALAKHPWLLPFCQIGRWIRIIFGGRLGYSILELKHNNNLTADSIENAAYMMHELQL